MIFYFTGTGNSLYVAKHIVGEGEELINIADCLREDNFTFELKKGETLGFICPVYFYSVPLFVRSFLKKLIINGLDLDTYVYTVFTCGGGRGEAGSMMKELLSQRKIGLKFVEHIVMPDNSMLFYQIPGNKGAEATLRAADKKIEMIFECISKRKTVKIRKTSVVTFLMDAMYKSCLKTAKFYADDSCIACGKCANNCPEKAIVMENGRPKWIKDTCGKCSACINNCPKEALQYGHLTKRRNRYHNPEI